MNQLFPALYSLAWGAWVAQLDTGALVEKLGFAGLSVALVYWITSRLSRQIDEQTNRLRELAEAVERTTEAVRGCPGRVENRHESGISKTL